MSWKSSAKKKGGSCWKSSMPLPATLPAPRRSRLPDTTVVAMFEQQVARAPDSTAVIQGELTLTYAELNERANRLAHWLMGQGVGGEALVGIALERSPEMVVAILAVWKAGGAYLPLDPEYPRARLEHMLADARPQLVLTTESLREHLPQSSGIHRFISLDTPELQS